MNSRKRVLSSAQDLFVGPSPASGSHSGASAPTQLHRVQTLSFDFATNSEPVNEYGQMAKIGDTPGIPTVNMSSSYYVVDVTNEQKLGLYAADGTNPVMKPALSSILDGTENEKNYFVFIAPEGTDSHNYSGNGSIIGIGNGTLASYNFNAAVGDRATASFDLGALNIVGYTNTRGGDIPAVNPQNGGRITGVNFTLPTPTVGESGKALALQQGDIEVDFGGAGFMADIEGISVQSIDISVDISLEDDNGLGYRLPRNKHITLPIDVTVSAEVTAGDLKSGDLSTLLCNNIGQTIKVKLYEPSCSGGDRPIVYLAEVRNATLDTQSWNGSIGPSDTLSLTWTAQIGSNNDTLNGLFLSGRGVNDYA